MWRAPLTTWSKPKTLTTSLASSLAWWNASVTVTASNASVTVTASNDSFAHGGDILCRACKSSCCAQFCLVQPLTLCSALLVRALAPVAELLPVLLRAEPHSTPPYRRSTTPISPLTSSQSHLSYLLPCTPYYFNQARPTLRSSSRGNPLFPLSPYFPYLLAS